MARRSSQDTAVGTVFALALVILALAIMALGSDFPGLSNRREFKVRFPSTDGLLLGAPVRMAGVQIGDVRRIRLPTDPSVLGIEVDLAIEQTYVARIREDSGATLRILQLLTNEKYVEILAGSPDRAELPEGSLLPIREDPGVLARGEAIAENLIDITASLKRILEPLERGEGLLGRIIQDPAFGLEGVEAFGETLENVKILTDDINSGKGLVGRMLRDEELAGKLDSLSAAVDEFHALMVSIQKREGLLGELLDEGGAGQEAIQELRDASASFAKLGKRLESEDTLLGQLLTERECARSLGDDICGTVSNLSAITGKISTGEGTLGALVNDRTVYDGAEDFLAGTNDSKFARWLLRHYRKRGIKAQEVEPEED